MLRELEEVGSFRVGSSNLSNYSSLKTHVATFSISPMDQ
jgi:hypothetical protein